MAKTKAQMEKKKREIEKRKKAEKEIRKIAAGMPDDDVEQGPTSPNTEADTNPRKA